ncbi:hypothetical protein BH10ACI2_BH10ACI2_16190 [soil metagenome]
MSKIKLDDRIENAMNAFFETEPDRSQFAMIYTGTDTASVADVATLGEKADKWSWILREIFLFGPGTFLLFYMTLTVAFFYPTVGISFQGFMTFFFGFFLTYAGSGSIRNIRHLAVPATVIAMAVGVVVFSLLFVGKERSDLYFWYSIYLLPNVLIAAKLVQIWVSKKK